MLAPLRLVPGFIVTATSRRLEIVRERADATGDRNMAGRVRERMRVMAEEAALLDSDRFEIHFSCLRGDHLFLPASVPTERNAACSKCAPPASRAFHSLKTNRHYLDHKKEASWFHWRRCLRRVALERAPRNEATVNGRHSLPPYQEISQRAA